MSGDRCALVLGDNLFFGHGLPERLRDAVAREKGATIFVHPVNDPERYGIAEFDATAVSSPSLRSRRSHAATWLLQDFIFMTSVWSRSPQASNLRGAVS